MSNDLAGLSKHHNEADYTGDKHTDPLAGPTRGLREQHDSSPCPLIIVEGFFGTSGPLLWGNFAHYLNLDQGSSQRAVMFASVGPVSSLHDRACELYYAIKGGIVDYGEAHSTAYGHKRFGRDRGPGLYPQWSRERPIHLLGHSIGGLTIVKLQDMLAQNCFPGGHPDMILSINTISSPFRGTQLVYTLGERVDAAPSVRPLSLGSALSRFVHIISFLSPYLPSWLDFHTESRSMSLRELSVGGLVRQLWRSEWAESRDATPFDVTFLAAEERESTGEGRTRQGTWYRSWVATCTNKPNDTLVHSPVLATLLLPPLYISSRLIASFDFTALKPAPAFLLCATTESSASAEKRRDDPEEDLESGGLATKTNLSAELGEEYFANDGVVPVFSQWHPLPCSSTQCLHLDHSLAPSKPLSLEDPKPGIWHVTTMDDVHHFSLVPLWLNSRRQKQFWVDMGEWLRRVDSSSRRLGRTSASGRAQSSATTGSLRV